MTQKKTSELDVEEMDVVNTAEVSDDSANADDAPAVALNEENKIEDNLPPAMDYLDTTLFKDIRTITKEDLDSSLEQTEVSKDIQDQYLGSISEISENQVLTGRVIGMNDKDILIDIGFKSEGLIDRSEFPQNALPQIGDQIEVYLEYLEDRNGNLVLSKEKADFMRRWRDIREFYEKEKIFTCKILRRIKGGMIVDIDGLQGFLPGSQIDVRPIKDFDQYLDQDLEVRVVKLNEARKNIVVSHKVIIEDSLKEKREELLADMEIGQIMEGRVKNITDFGVFIDLGGIDGLLHITDLSWGRVNHPSEVVKLDETLSIKIIDYDKEKQRVSLGLKQLMPHPWENVEKNYPIGSNVKGKIVSLTNYGAFVELEAGVEGLIHVSEMSWTRHIKNASEMYSIGEEIKAGVLSIDTDERKISLGVKQLEPDPWDEIEEKYIPGNLVKGKVINLTQFGAFIELEEGIDGLIHVSDLSWTKIVRHPKEILGKNEEIEVRILEVSRESRRISLGIKQIEDDPWPGLSKTFQSGKKVEGEIVRILDRGIILGLEHDVEGIIPFSRQSKRNKKSISSKYKIGDKMSAVVMEIKSDDKKVILFVEELSGEKSSEKDNVKQFLDNQSEPVGEKIEIPTEDLDQASDINED